MGRRKSEDKLTPFVLEFKETENGKVLNQLMKASEGLIWTVMKYYHMYYFPKLIQEEVVEDCKTIILLRAIEGFNFNKGRFSTYYTWKLKSFIRYRQHFLLKRKKLVEHSSLDQEIIGKEHMSLDDFIHNFDLVFKQKCSKQMREIFSI